MPNSRIFGIGSSYYLQILKSEEVTSMEWKRKIQLMKQLKICIPKILRSSIQPSRRFYSLANANENFWIEK